MARIVFRSDISFPLEPDYPVQMQNLSIVGPCLAEVPVKPTGAADPEIPEIEKL